MSNVFFWSENKCEEVLGSDSIPWTAKMSDLISFCTPHEYCGASLLSRESDLYAHLHFSESWGPFLFSSPFQRGTGIQRHAAELVSEFVTAVH